MKYQIKYSISEKQRIFHWKEKLSVRLKFRVKKLCDEKI